MKQNGSSGIAIPEHVQKNRQAQMMEQQMIAAARGEIQRLKISVAREIFEPLARAKFNSISSPDSEVDLNLEAAYSLRAANFLLHHAGFLKQLEDLEQAQADQQPPEAEKQKIIT
jgi:hypothetical protein